MALVCNNLGSTTPLEMAVAAKAAAELVQRRLGAQLERLYCGRYLTSLDMHGLSLTLMRLHGDTLQLLDAPTQVCRCGVLVLVPVLVLALVVLMDGTVCSAHRWRVMRRRQLLLAGTTSSCLCLPQPP